MICRERERWREREGGRERKEEEIITSWSDWIRCDDSSIGSYSGSSLNFWAHYDFFNNSQHEGRKSAATDCDVVYEPPTRSSGVWTSPYNTLLYKRSSDSPDLKCRYAFQVGLQI